MIQLEKFIENDFNLMEIYLISKRNEISVDINLKPTIIEKIKNKYSNWKKTNQVIFKKNKMQYQYETNNDNQILFTKDIIDRNSLENIEVLTYKYCKIPTYMFPCVNDIDEKVEYETYESKITNRISLFIRTNEYASSVYIEYKHSVQAEKEKNEIILNEIIRNITDATIS